MDVTSANFDERHADLVSQTRTINDAIFEMCVRVAKVVNVFFWETGCRVKRDVSGVTPVVTDSTYDSDNIFTMLELGLPKDRLRIKFKSFRPALGAKVHIEQGDPVVHPGNKEEVLTQVYDNPASEEIWATVDRQVIESRRLSRVDMQKLSWSHSQSDTESWQKKVETELSAGISVKGIGLSAKVTGEYEWGESSTTTSGQAGESGAEIGRESAVAIARGVAAEFTIPAFRRVEVLGTWERSIIQVPFEVSFPMEFNIDIAVQPETEGYQKKIWYTDDVAQRLGVDYYYATDASTIGSYADEELSEANEANRDRRHIYDKYFKDRKIWGGANADHIEFRSIDDLIRVLLTGITRDAEDSVKATLKGKPIDDADSGAHREIVESLDKLRNSSLRGFSAKGHITFDDASEVDIECRMIGEYMDNGTYHDTPFAQG